MSLLRPGDDRIHYSDGSHRWIPPAGVQQEAWDAGVRAHLILHMATMGGRLGDAPAEPVQIEHLGRKDRQTLIEGAQRRNAPRQRTRRP